MTPILLGLVCALLIGIGTSAYFWLVRRRQDEAAEGLRALSAMHWREFATLVLEMVFRRGYEAVDRHPLGSGDQSDILLTRQGEVCVLSCKHGSAHQIGGSVFTELANSIRLNDAAGGIVVTAGDFAPEAHQQAKAQRVELIDGKALWPEISPLIPENLRQTLRAGAGAQAKRRMGIGWLAGIAAGVAIVLLMPSANDEPNVSAITPAATAPAVPAKPPVIDGIDPNAPPPLVSAAALTPEQVETRRADTVSAIAALPGIERAIWSTQSTLSLFLIEDRSDVWDGVCGILDRYDELRATRVQINPPPDSNMPVRFKQCHAY